MNKAAVNSYLRVLCEHTFNSLGWVPGDTVVRLDGRLGSALWETAQLCSSLTVPLRIPHRLYHSVSPPSVPLRIPTISEWELLLLLIFISIWCCECLSFNHMWVSSGVSLLYFVIHNDICCWTSLHMLFCCLWDVCSDLSPFLFGLFCPFLWLRFWSSSYILDTSSSSDSVLQYILLFCGTSFHFIVSAKETMSFAEQTFLNFNVVQLISYFLSRTAF